MQKLKLIIAIEYLNDRLLEARNGVDVPCEHPALWAKNEAQKSST